MICRGLAALCITFVSGVASGQDSRSCANVLDKLNQIESAFDSELRRVRPIGEHIEDLLSTARKTKARMDLVEKYWNFGLGGGLGTFLFAKDQYLNSLERELLNEELDEFEDHVSYVDGLLGDTHRAMDDARHGIDCREPGDFPSDRPGGEGRGNDQAPPDPVPGTSDDDHPNTPDGPPDDDGDDRGAAIWSTPFSCNNDDTGDDPFDWCGDDKPDE